jgi:tetratricopeptide (TPR) repeat protein
MEPITTSRIGIWDIVPNNGQEYYVRNADMRNEWHYWADIKKIAHKSEDYRIAFLGESVARGYLYDPFFNPGTALEKMLKGSGWDKVEVVDLARVNHDLEEVTQLATECMALDPDALVVFGGNNWIISVRKSIEEDDYKDMLRSLKGNDMSVIKEWFKKRSHIIIEKFFENLRSLCGKKNIPVILVIPEFNLLHWQSSEEEHVLTNLSGENTKSWLSACKKAQEAIEDNDLERAENFCRRMITIDPSHPLGYEWLAKCLLKKGLNSEARENLQEALDTAIYSRAVSKPRLYSFMRESALSLAPSYNIHIVDLPEIFSKHLGGELPGRSLFLDYCHLSSEGIRLAMEATANSIMGIKKGPPKTVDKEVVNRVKPTDDVEAHAIFCAAIHNAHYGQPYEQLFTLCKEALEASTQVKGLMTGYIDFATRRLPNYFCRSFKNVMGTNGTNQYEGGKGFLSRTGNKIMDILLVDAIVDALKLHGYDVEQEIKDLRKSEHGAHIRTVNLLESYYAANTHYSSHFAKKPYYQFRGAVSRFYLVAEGNRPVNVQLTYRNRNKQATETDIVVKINNKIIDTLPGSQQWHTISLLIDGSMINDGVNTITIDWPPVDTTKLKADNNTAKPEEGMLDYSFPVVGEIHLFTASQTGTGEDGNS